MPAERRVNRPDAVVCIGQTGVNALATIRSLGRRGVGVHAVSLAGSKQIAAKSRYCLAHHEASDMGDLMRVLEGVARESRKAVLYVDNDRMLRALQRHARELQRLFRVVDPIPHAYELTDKRAQV